MRIVGGPNFVTRMILVVLFLVLAATMASGAFAYLVAIWAVEDEIEFAGQSLVHGLSGSIVTIINKAGAEGELQVILNQSLTVDKEGRIADASIISKDMTVVAALTELTAGASSFCTTLRLMSGHELASEGFAKGQTGSSAMPHKMNARSCERINGFHVILKGYLTMASGLSGIQWNEGDVSCSVVRRVMLPDAFYAADGLFETFLTILGQMDAYPGVIGAENNRYLPFLLSTTILMAAVTAGVGREPNWSATICFSDSFKNSTIGSMSVAVDTLLAPNSPNTSWASEPNAPPSSSSAASSRPFSLRQCRR